ncbi:acyltransferase [Acinetobacter sp. WCHAc060025]|uniref:acyltransferase n=1 Tax=Acinetobacter sp. WCHAc060025 TaxID=2518625 RepID=UPI001022C601|nr:acyltransferase [Acinetobacter sp. WCHAc060025]RZG76958.1 acyltransferase [Acinetobacter sp. WCHAc060025]
MFNLNSIKMLLLKKNNKNHVFIEGELKVLGYLPYFKTPKNGKVFLGENVVLNSDFKRTNTALTYRCKFVTGYDGVIKIGKHTMLNGVCIVSYENVEIGEECQIASSTIISDTDFHPVEPTLRSKQVKGENFPFSSVGKKAIKIGNNVWIGWNCTILKGVVIGDDCIVAAGSVVLAGSYPKGSLIAGNPAKVIKSYI